MMCETCIPIVYGSPKAATYHRKILNLTTNFSMVNTPAEAQEGRLNMISCFDEEVKIDFGIPSPESGHAALLSLQRAIKDYRNGDIDVLVTAPINKASIQNSDFHFTGHTEYLEHELGEGKESLMILMSSLMKVALVTTHLPIKDVAKAITKENIIEKATIFSQSLKRDMRISAPRIAVLALNPHAGDGGVLGTEEQDIISPAIAELEQQGVLAFGPYAADGFFGSGTYAHYDGVLAMYHDQGLAPFKTLALENGVNFTAGLPIVRTSPDHGTAYDIAGKGIADEQSFRQAIYAAIDIYRNRQNYDEPLADPLPKLYHEKREDGEKARFTIKAKDQFKREDDKDKAE
jgi:4-hydroxythreonine-4-phosphate dehydrogenase